MAEHQASVGEGSGDKVFGLALGDDLVKSPQDPGVEGHGQDLRVVAPVDEGLPEAKGRVDIGRRRQQGRFRSQDLPGEEVHPRPGGWLPRPPLL